MIIGISGKMQSGKNTVASIIQMLTSPNYKNNYLYKVGIDVNRLSEYDFSDSIWKQKAFATKLKQIVSILTGIPVEDLEKQEVKNRVLGEEWDRYLLKEHWINDEYAEHEQFTYFASNEDMQKYISDMNHTDSTCQQVGKTSITVRQLLQELGTDLLRNQLHPNVHINDLFADYNNTERNQYILDGKTEKMIQIGNLPESNWIITDVRFPNELQAIKDRGGITIRVNRPKLYQGEDVLKGMLEKSKEHESETALDNSEFDYVIDNNGSIEELIEKVKQVLIKEKIII